MNRAYKLILISLSIFFALSAFGRDKDAADVSLIQLISNPHKYNGKFVRVTGYLAFDDKGADLFFHQEDYESTLLRDAIWIGDIETIKNQREKFDKKYVFIEGIFDGKHRGPYGRFSGELRHVTRFDLHWRFGKRTTVFGDK